MKVISLENRMGITKGKQYTVKEVCLKEENLLYRIISDYGDVAGYFSYRFVVCDAGETKLEDFL